ncbi:MAG: sulfite oxidase-like oxidoreductase [Chloroflexi bacterium]|nr:sulfite oxidase-like oxidoreductase [Chloroflexota bacterium]
MAFNFFNKGRLERSKALGDRLPPGQYQTEKWPVLHYGSVPAFNPETWTFTVSGLVENPMHLTYAQFRDLPTVTIKTDIHCVTRWSMFDSEWTGVAFRDIMRLVRPRPEARFVMALAENKFTANVPLADLDRDDVLLLFQRNGENISPEHGWPLRLFVPHLYFWKSAKWLRGLEFVAEDKAGFWESYGYHMRGDPWKEERYDGD